MTSIESTLLLTAGLGFVAAGNSLYQFRRDDLIATSSGLMQVFLQLCTYAGFFLFIGSVIAGFLTIKWYLVVLALFGSIWVWGWIYPPIVKKAMAPDAIASRSPYGLRTFVRAPLYAAICYVIGLTSLLVWNYFGWYGRP